MRDITGTSSVLYGTGSRRYAPGSQIFHWVTAALIFVIIPLGWIFAEFKTKGNPPTAFEAPLPGVPGEYASVHKTLGLLVFALVVLRLLYRLANRAPALPIDMNGAERIMARTSHWLLYVVILLMPISGYLTSSASKHPISVFGLFDVPKLPVSKQVGEAAGSFHVYAQWLLLALIAVHILATAWHLFVRRDAILDRMLPRQANAD